MISAPVIRIRLFEEESPLVKLGEKGAKPECVFKQCDMRGRDWRRPRRPRTEAGRSRKWRTRDRRGRSPSGREAAATGGRASP